MKVFLKNLLKFFAIFTVASLLLTVFNVFVVREQYRGEFTAALDDKLERLKSIKEPKIILLGDSNLAFGMDSALLEKETGMPVVNMGLHGGLGNAFDERIAYGNVSEGDIVIVSETGYGDDDTIPGYDLAWITMEYNTDLWYVLSPRDYPKFFLSYPAYAFDSFWRFVTGTGNKFRDNQYSRDAFNQYGDVVRKPESARLDAKQLFSDGSVTIPGISSACVNRLNDLNKYVEEQGAVMAVAAYPIADGEFTPSKEDYRDFQSRLEEELDCEVISDFTDYFIPYRYFYDTVYHLDNEGAVLRTQKLATDIKKWRSGSASQRS